MTQMEHQIQTQKTKKPGWIFDKFNSMKIIFYKTGEVNGSSYVKTALRSSFLTNIKNNDENCFIWSILVSLHPWDNDHSSRVSNFSQFFVEINFDVFDFSNGFKCSDFQYFEKLNKLSINIFELSFDQEKNKWKHMLIPLEVSKNDSDRVFDLLIHKNHYALIKKFNVFLGDHHKSFICRRCLNSYTKENMLKIHEPKCENIKNTTIRTSPESHL